MQEFNLKLRMENAGAVADTSSANVKAMLEAMAKSLAVAAYNMGVNHVQQKLDTTRQQYLDHFHYTQIDSSNHLIALDAEADFLDSGYQGFDMKPGLLNGPKARVSKTGKRYNIIPFFHKKVGAATNLVDQLKGEEIQRNLKNGINRAGKSVDLNKTQKNVMGLSEQGIVGRIKSNPQQHPHLRGMVKIQKKYGKATQSQLMTFRIVSDNSSSRAWWHPGYDGVQAFTAMSRFLETEINRVINSTDTRFL